jgi:2-oxoglutarate ferredoxin oxidoreductase subunit gamma
MLETERFEIRIAGFGGQGVVTIGRILGAAFSVFAGINSVNTQSYGPESRGGACRSEVVVSKADINYPYVRRADVLIALSQVALDTYRHDLKKGGLLMIDPDSVQNVAVADDVRLVPIPVSALAHDSVGIKYQNVVALGALQALISDYIEAEAVVKAIEAIVPPNTLAGNRAAFEKGQTFVRELMSNA